MGLKIAHSLDGLTVKLFLLFIVSLFFVFLFVFLSVCINLSICRCFMFRFFFFSLSFSHLHYDLKYAKSLRSSHVKGINKKIKLLTFFFMTFTVFEILLWRLMKTWVSKAKNTLRSFVAISQLSIEKFWFNWKGLDF